MGVELAGFQQSLTVAAVAGTAIAVGLVEHTVGGGGVTAGKKDQNCIVVREAALAWLQRCMQQLKAPSVLPLAHLQAKKADPRELGGDRPEEGQVVGRTVLGQ